MPDNKGVGWRKKIQGSKSKDIQPPKTGGDDIAAADSSDRRRHHGWRKTIHGSRPNTPVDGSALLTDDAEDARSELSEVSTPRRNSKPKLTRYTSLFSSFKESSKGPEFAEPWSEDAPPPFQPYIDPLNALQSIRSHMIASSSKPIPLEHNNGLFRIFEDYRKVREEKEHLETLLQDTLQDWKKAEDHWNDSEGRYEAEIRRLDLLIARGTSGMLGLIKARQGSVVDRKRRHHTTFSNKALPQMFESISSEQLDNEIKLRSQRVLLRRSASPSGKMIALSKQFTNTNVDLPVGNPPDEHRRMTLSRKVQSELDLTTMARIETLQPITNSVDFDYCGRVADPSPDKVTAPTPALMESAIECDAFVALRELGTLVARRRGLKVDGFIESLVMLFSNACDADIQCGVTEEQESQPASMDNNWGDPGKTYMVETLTSARSLRRFQSQPQLSSDQRRRRHFSFEPGDDQLHELDEEFKLHEARYRDSDSSDADTHSSAHLRNPTLGLQIVNSQPSTHALLTDFQKPSKIPSPVQTLGRVRRENSASSLQSVVARPCDDRRDSRSSILMAFPDSSSGSLRLDSKSRSTSMHSLLTADSPLLSKDSQGSLRFRNSPIALATARAAEKKSVSSGGSPTRSSTRPFTVAL